MAHPLSPRRDKREPIHYVKPGATKCAHCGAVCRDSGNSRVWLRPVCQQLNAWNMQYPGDDLFRRCIDDDIPAPAERSMGERPGRKPIKSSEKPITGNMWVYLHACRDGEWHYWISMLPNGSLNRTIATLETRGLVNRSVEDTSKGQKVGAIATDEGLKFIKAYLRGTKTYLVDTSKNKERNAKARVIAESVDADYQT